MQSNTKYFLMGLGSYTIWGFLPIFFRLLKNYNQYEIILYRIIIAAIVMIVLILFLKKLFISDLKAFINDKNKTKTITLTLLGSVCLVFNWLAYIYVVNDISVNAAAFSYFVLPIFTAFLARVILKEKLNRNKYLGIILSSISCILLANIGYSEISYVLVVTITYSFYMISQRKNTSISRVSSLSIQLIFGSFFMIIVNPAELKPASLDLNFYFLIGIIVVVFTVIPLFMNLYALNGLESAQLAFLIYINPISTFLLGVFLYQESFTWISVLAYIILFLAILSFNWDLLKVIFNRFERKAKIV